MDKVKAAGKNVVDAGAKTMLKVSCFILAGSSRVIFSTRARCSLFSSYFFFSSMLIVFFNEVAEEGKKKISRECGSWKGYSTSQICWDWAIEDW